MNGRSGNQWPSQQMGGYHNGMMQQQQQHQGQQYGWQGQPGGIPPPPPQQQFRPPPPRGPAPPPPPPDHLLTNSTPRPPSNGTWAPQVSLQPHHWQQQQQQQQQQQVGYHPGGGMFPRLGQQHMHPMAGGAGVQYTQPPMMMHPGHFQQHFQQQFQASGQHNNNNFNSNQGQMRQHNQNQRKTQNNKRSTMNYSNSTPLNNNTTGNGKDASAERVTPSLSLPPSKRQKKKDRVPPLEKITVDPTVREPINEAERAEIEAWKAERRKHWPSEDNIIKKQQDHAARRARGELIDPRGDVEISRKIRLQEILQRQRAMGLSKQAGTEEMLIRLSGSTGTESGPFSDRGQGRGGGRSGRGGRENGGGGGGRGGRGRGRNGPEYGYQSFIDAGDAPQIDPGLEKWRQRQEEEKKEKEIGAGNELQKQGDMQGGKGDAAVVVINEEDKEIRGAITRNEVNNTEENQKNILTMVSDSDAGIALALPLPVDNEGDDRQHQQQQTTGRGRGSRDRGRGGRTGRGRGRGRESHNNNDSRQQQQRRHPHQQQHPHPSLSFPQAPPSLLEKLLSKEIRQDMSYILQAFRFFVMNNFFQSQNQEQQQRQQQQGSEAQIVFPVAAVEEEEAMMTKKDRPLAATACSNKKPTIEDILKNKEGIDIDITDDEDEELIEQDNEGTEPSSGTNESDGDDEDGTALIE